MFNGHSEKQIKKSEEEHSEASENDGRSGKMLETSSIHVMSLTSQVMGQKDGH